uniref:F-box domain-containing protein n=1 Tax=Leersia perrieri TaxID=77586 RepID=A0A0D9WF63_9ORYZ
MAKRNSCNVVTDDDDTRQSKKMMKTAVTSTASGPLVLPFVDYLVWEEILMQLPSTSLARLRCTSRSWNERITSDGFVEGYLQRQQKLAMATDNHKLVLPPLSKGHAIGSWRRSPLQARLCRDCPRMVGARPCRGLVLFCRPCAAQTYSVCYPSTGGVLHLPRPSDDDDDDECIIADADPVLANGRLHWTLSAKFLTDNPAPQAGILVFSIGDETFTTVPMPPFASADLVQCGSVYSEPYMEHIRPSRSRNGDYVYTPAGTVLAELDGCLCMVRDLRRRARAGESCMFEIWKLSSSIRHTMTTPPAAAGHWIIR